MGQNCNIDQNGILRAIKNIKIGKEFFWDEILPNAIYPRSKILAIKVNKY
jgi:hypothetical protein